MQIQKVNSNQNFGVFVRTSEGLFNPEHITRVFNETPGKTSILLLGRAYSTSFRSKISIEEIAVRIARAIQEKDPMKIIDLGV